MAEPNIVRFTVDLDYGPVAPEDHEIPDAGDLAHHLEGALGMAGYPAVNVSAERIQTDAD